MLTFVIHLFVGAVTSGVALVVALLLGYGTLAPLLGAAVLGFVAAFPLSWIIARRLSGNGR